MGLNRNLVLRILLGVIGAAAIASSSVLAQETRGTLRISLKETDDSSVLLEGEAPSDAAQILVTIERAGEGNRGEQNLFPVESRRFSTRVYLRHGPGSYSLKLYKCKKAQLTCSGIGEFSIRNLDTRELSFLLPSAQVQSDSPEIQELARSITQNARNDLERSKLIHDWVASKVAYDTEAYFSGNYLNMRWDASTALHRLVSICQGYANLTAALHRAIGIRAKVVTGRAASVFTGSDRGASLANESGNRCNHAWNEVLVDGEWIPLDTTWDAGFVDFVSREFTFNPRSAYFNPPRSEWEKTHQKCEDSSS